MEEEDLTINDVIGSIPTPASLGKEDERKENERRQVRLMTFKRSLRSTLASAPLRLNPQKQSVWSSGHGSFLLTWWLLSLGPISGPDPEPGGFSGFSGSESGSDFGLGPKPLSSTSET